MPKLTPEQRAIVERGLSVEAKRASANYQRSLEWPSGKRVFSDDAINRMLDPRHDDARLSGTHCHRDDRIAMAVFSIIANGAKGGRDKRAKLHGVRVGAYGREHWRKVLRGLLRKREPVSVDARAIIRELLRENTPNRKGSLMNPAERKMARDEDAKLPLPFDFGFLSLRMGYKAVPKT